MIRLVRYERAAGEPAPLPEQMRMGAHTDYGIFTTLLADPIAGLQIVGPDGEWIDVVPEPDAVVINIGDALAMWTNDKWRSTLHRVVPPADTDGPVLRRSFPFFHDGNADAVIECLPSCLAPGERAEVPAGHDRRAHREQGARGAVTRRVDERADRERSPSRLLSFVGPSDVYLT